MSDRARRGSTLRSLYKQFWKSRPYERETADNSECTFRKKLVRLQYRGVLPPWGTGQTCGRQHDSNSTRQAYLQTDRLLHSLCRALSVCKSEIPAATNVQVCVWVDRAQGTKVAACLSRDHRPARGYGTPYGAMLPRSRVTWEQAAASANMTRQPGMGGG